MPDTDVLGPTPDDLGARFAALGGGQTWEIDGAEQLVSPVEEDASLQSPPTAPAGNVEEKPTRAQSGSVEEHFPPTPAQIIEALLFAGGPPLQAERACQIIRGLTPEQFRECIDTLNRRFRAQGRPYAVATAERGCTLTAKASFRGEEANRSRRILNP